MLNIGPLVPDSLRELSVKLAIQVCNLQTYKAPFESKAQGTSVSTSAASDQRGWPQSIF